MKSLKDKTLLRISRLADKAIQNNELIEQLTAMFCDPMGLTSLLEQPAPSSW